MGVPMVRLTCSTLLCLCLVFAAYAQDAPDPPGSAIADPADLAFEEGRWLDAIAEYRRILDRSPEDRLSLLRIAQAQRELKRHADALETLEEARTMNAPEAMVDFERARNLLALGQRDEGLAALDSADHVGLRALALLEESEDFAAVRGESRFERVLRSVRGRVYPCEGMPEASQFDFWVGRWEVRMPDGTLIGHNTISKRDGGCSVVEQWDGAGGSSGTSVSFFVPSRDEWRQVWTGSSGTLIDITGGLNGAGAMHMEGTIEYVYPERVVAFRGTWTVADDGRVRQRMEEFDLAAQTWVLWFDGIYRRLDPASVAD
jgi:tetratricopeptide (TPR) repeat protein